MNVSVGIVMVNPMGQLDQAKDTQIDDKIIISLCLGDCFWGLAFDLVKKTVFPSVSGYHLIVGGLNRAKRWKDHEFSLLLFDLVHPSSSTPRCWNFGVLGLQIL